MLKFFLNQDVSQVVGFSQCRAKDGILELSCIDGLAFGYPPLENDDFEVYISEQAGEYEVWERTLTDEFTCSTFSLKSDAVDFFLTIVLDLTSR
jgi:hypothetical protein